jgi:hypothetical protein
MEFGGAGLKPGPYMQMGLGWQKKSCENTAMRCRSEQ